TVVAALLAAGADPSARTSTGATPLMLAAASGSAETVTVLLEQRVDPNATEAAHGETALMFAAALDRADVVRELLRHGADARVASATTDLTGITAPEEDLQNEIRDAQNAKDAQRSATGQTRR